MGAEGDASGQGLLLAARGIAKSFGPTQALRDASFELRSGEVHVLVGENGCGKSTLVKILSGVHAPDAGSIAIDGQAPPPLRSPRVAQSAGIVTVFQEVLVAEARSVLDNVWLGTEGLVRAPRSGREKRELARVVLGELLGEPVDLGTPVEELSLSHRQACGIARALVRQPRILILDEATSALDVATRDRLFAILARLGEVGVGVVFITHRMDEIVQIGDRVTVMRSGETVTTLEREQVTPARLVQLMTGSDELTEHAREEAPARPRGRPALSVDAVVLAEGRAPVDLELHGGQLVGVAGLEGQGQEAFLHALRGVPAVSGEVRVHAADGSAAALRSPRDAAARGIAYVPRERRRATFAWMSIAENFGMPTLKEDARAGWLSFGRTKRRLAAYVGDLAIRLRRPLDRITTLSGGNQQKVVIARFLAAQPRVLLLNDPTRGVDIGAKRDLDALLVRLAAEGLAVVMLSSELDEHVELMDRVLVFREHELYREIDRAGLGRDSLVSAFFGQPTEEPAHGVA